MHVLEKAFIDLLRNYLPIPDGKIFAGSRYIPQDLTPCVTVQLADESFIRRHYVEIDNIQYSRKLYNANVWINVWCNTEEERQSLVDAIDLRINQAEEHHYTTCSNYNLDDNTCTKSMNVCESLNSQGGRANKGQCPNVRNYHSFFENNNIPKRSFNVNSVTDLDELDPSEPILRTIFRLQLQYYRFYRIGGQLFKTIHINEGLL